MPLYLGKEFPEASEISVLWGNHIETVLWMEPEVKANQMGGGLLKRYPLMLTLQRLSLPL